MSKTPVPVEAVAHRILLIRGEKVMLDADLAELYGVPTKALNQAVKRNIERFPGDFMFQLSKLEKDEVVTSCDHLANLKFSRTLSFAFTEHGALMLGNVLKSDRAIEASLLVVRTFVQLRQMLSTHKELAAKLEALERKIGSHDQAIAGLIDAIRQLMAPTETGKRQIGFITGDMSGKMKK
ncbi:ORF6N domain-containing protein [Thiobacillus sp.]|uniref:ORF6N domain-containing protein n=1 Tax=Thiobacillus sp. TaxID=924 RepID=UPI0025FAAF96|nr:ORF6N domain-containing protein [Thiobacillus sp.]